MKVHRKLKNRPQKKLNSRTCPKIKEWQIEVIFHTLSEVMLELKYSGILLRKCYPVKLMNK